ncbi:MAG: transporter [Verrucomicrobia bacterium]|nr:transporter [Verrucomicrobiota bacterium]
MKYPTIAINRALTILLIILAINSSTQAGEPATMAPAGSTTPARGTLFQWSSNVTGGPDLNEPLVTDRPDFTEASVTVGKGVAQIELGYTYIDSDGSDVHSLGEPLLRYGILEDWLELRLAIFPQTESGERGFSDLYFGFKIALTPQEGLLPEMALIPQTFVPTGSNAFSSNGWEPGINWIYAWQINGFISTAGSTQINRRFEDSGDDFLRLAQSWTIAFTLTEKVGAYTEWFALFPTGSGDNDNEHYFNGGLTYLINNNIQADIRAGWGLNEAAEDFFIGAGLSVRFQ